MAPSVSPAELPAVTRPPTRNGVGRSAMASSVVSGRRNSSRSATRQPLSPKTVIGTTVSRMTPFCQAAARRWCERTANASASSLVSCGKRSCRFSAVAPMDTAEVSTIRSATKRGLKSTSSPIGWWPMCSTPPARATSAAPKASSPAAIVTAVSAPAHMRSTARPGTEAGRPASSPTSRPSVRPWSPTWAVAANTTSPTRSGGTFGLRRRTSRTAFTAMSSARVRQKTPLGPARPNGVRTPSTK